MRYCLLFLSSLLALSSCYDEPEFPVVPEIGFERVRFRDMPTGAVDTLLVTISFRDGDGDIGLNGTEITPPYEPYSFVPFENSLLRLGDLDTLPEFNCRTYQVGRITGTTFVQEPKGPDTVYIKRNLFHSNFFLDFYKVIDGQEVFFDFSEATNSFCNEVSNNRIPRIDTGESKPISGSITYRFVSRGLVPLLGNDSIKVKVRIADRALHLSNIAESPVFTLRGVQINK